MEKEKTFDLNALIEKGKKKGSLTADQIASAAELADVDIDEIEKIYEKIEAEGIVITNEPDEETIEIEADVEKLGNA